MVNILVAEDEPVLRMLICDSLEDEGYTISTAADGEEALQLIQTCKYDLAILDHMMPKLTGLEVIQAVKGKEIAPVKIMMLSAKSQLSDREQAIQFGADAFVSKPFSPIELVRKVGELLE